MTAPVIDSLASVTLILQTALTPAFLLVAIGSLLNMFVGRLARIVDRSRDLQALHPKTSGNEHQLVVDELRILEKRMSVVSASILILAFAPHMRYLYPAMALATILIAQLLTELGLAKGQ